MSELDGASVGSEADAEPSTGGLAEHSPSPAADEGVAPLPATSPSSRRRLGLVLWLAGMAGVLAFSALPLPQELTDARLAVPLWLIQLAGLVQSGVLLALAVWIGVRFAPRVGLRAPAFETLVSHPRETPRALLPQLLPGLVGGVLGAAILRGFGRTAPAEVEAVVASGFDPTLVVRVLYGGITEELLLRWGVMTLLLWILWRVVQRGRGRPHAILGAVAIVASALVFGLGHLPTVLAYGGELTRGVVLYVLLGNGLFGIVTGTLYWRRGLEAAMLAHALAHVIVFVA